MVSPERGYEINQKEHGLQHLTDNASRHPRLLLDGECRGEAAHNTLKNLHASLGPRSACVTSYRGDKDLVGTVASSGTHDELSSRQYLLVRDAGRQLEYIRVANAEALAEGVICPSVGR